MTSLGIDIGGTSIKLACVRDGATLWTARSSTFSRPARNELISAVRDALGARAVAFDAIGLCCPGLLDRPTRTITLSVNVPGLTGQNLDVLTGEFLGPSAPPPVILSDANAAAFDLYSSWRLTGRLLVLALGTGIGASVVDDGQFLSVDGDSPGHFGQLDCSLDDSPPIGPDAGAGSLEAYLGVAALRSRYGEDFHAKLSTLPATEPPFRALARAVRIAHAIYRPHHVAVAGGIGNALTLQIPALRQLIETGLTNIARPAWTFFTGDSDYHAALGAARFAAQPSA